MMLSHFFLGFSDGLAGLSRASPRELAAALRRAVDSLYRAVEKPVEGTILTVIREFTEEAERLSLRVRKYEVFARQLLQSAQRSLERTPEQLPVLREAGVVDAGAKGFVRFIEGVVHLVDEGRSGVALQPSAPLDVRYPAASVDFPGNAEEGYRYCTEFLLRGEPTPEQPDIMAAVQGLGSSLIVTRASTIAKIHVHTDDPAEVESALGGLNVTVELIKAEDMRAQHDRLRGEASRRVGLVTDTTCDLPPELILEHRITVVPMRVMFGDEAFFDQIEITHEEFLRRLVDPNQPRPTTSQPSPAELEKSYSHAAEDADELLGIFVSGALSGTLGQARAAAARFDGARISTLDSRSASLGLGFQVLRAAELAREGLSAEEISAELERLQRRSGTLLTLDTLEYAQRSGRLGRAKAFVAGLLDLKPILSLDVEGAVVPVDRVRGREALIPRVIQLLSARIPRERERLRIGVAHVMCRDVADRVVEEVRREFEPDEVHLRPVTGVLAAHAGPGAWVVFYQAE